MTGKVVFTEEERTFVQTAIGAGMPRSEIVMIIIIARLTEKPIIQVRDHMLDVQFGIGQVFREMYSVKTPMPQDVEIENRNIGLVSPMNTEIKDANS